jgi:hypothetical protein
MSHDELTARQLRDEATQGRGNTHGRRKPADPGNGDRIADGLEPQRF